MAVNNEDDIAGLDVAKTKIVLGDAGQVDGLLKQGQQTSAKSLSVVFASDAASPAATLPEGAATSAKQDTQSVSLASIAEWAGDLKVFLRQVLAALRAPGWVDQTLNRMRGTVIVESLPTLANVTTVATVTNVAQLGTSQAQIAAFAMERASWALNCRARIS